MHHDHARTHTHTHIHKPHATTTPTNLEHLVGLVEDQDADGAHVQHALLHPVAQLAMGADDDLGVCGGWRWGGG